MPATILEFAMDVLFGVHRASDRRNAARGRVLQLESDPDGLHRRGRGRAGPAELGWLGAQLDRAVRTAQAIHGGSFGEVLLIVVISRVAAVVASTFLFAGMLVS